MNYKCVLAYDGRRYKGFRKTNNPDETIQGKLEAILKKRFEKEIEVISAINTDAGVHATHQIVNFKVADTDLTAEEIQEYFDSYLPEDIVLRSVEIADERFHSRYNASKVTYQYRLWKSNPKTRPLFERQLVNKMTQRLNVSKMKAGAELFVGEHDFAGFATKAKTNGTIKTVEAVTVEETDDEILISITANGFLLNMERIMIGTLVQIGLEDRAPASITKVFASKNREDAGHKIMAHALCLVNVEMVTPEN